MKIKKVVEVEVEVLKIALKLIDQHFYDLEQEWSAGPLAGLYYARKCKEELYARGDIKRCLKTFGG